MTSPTNWSGFRQYRLLIAQDWPRYHWEIRYGVQSEHRPTSLSYGTRDLHLVKLPTVPGSLDVDQSSDRIAIQIADSILEWLYQDLRTERGWRISRQLQECRRRSGHPVEWERLHFVGLCAAISSARPKLDQLDLFTSSLAALICATLHRKTGWSVCHKLVWQNDTD